MLGYQDASTSDAPPPLLCPSPHPSPRLVPRDTVRRYSSPALSVSFDDNFVPPRPLVEKVERESVEVNPFVGAFARPALPLGDLTVSIHRGKPVSLGLPPSAHRTLLSSLRGLVVLLVALVAIDFLDPSVSSELAFFAHMGFSLLLTSFVFVQQPHRMGRLKALSKLRAPEGYHFLIGYAWADGAPVARSLASVLSHAGASVWLDVYRLENAFSLQQTVHHAATRAAYLVLIVTPQFVCSPNCCLELLAALRRPAEQVLAYIDGGASWSDGQYKRVSEFLLAQGFRVVTARLDVLIKALDGVLMSQEEHHATWWRRQRVGEDLLLRNVLSRVRDVDGRPKQRLSLRGRLLVPRGAVSSGLHMLSSDGRTFASVVALPPSLIIAVVGFLCLVGLLVLSLWVYLPLGIFEASDVPSLLVLTAVLLTGVRLNVHSMREADARLHHSVLEQSLRTQPSASPKPKPEHTLAW